jgi:hypothetical protein
MPADEIADDRLAADEKFVGHDVPRPDQDAAGGDRVAKPRLLLGANLEVILEHDRLSVEMEILVIRILVEQVEQAIDEGDQPHPELLEREVPLAIPMGVRDDVNLQHQR